VKNQEHYKLHVKIELEDFQQIKPLKTEKANISTTYILLTAAIQNSYLSKDYQ